MIGTILFVTFLVLLVIGAPIALCLGAAALLVVFTTGDVSPIVWPFHYLCWQAI